MLLGSIVKIFTVDGPITRMVLRRSIRVGSAPGIANVPSDDPKTQIDETDTTPASSAPTDVLDVEPLGFRLLAQFFGIPLLIISLIVGGAICVVLLFGAPATAPQRSVAALLQELEANSGERSMGLLLTQEKELWQTALELSNRLEHKDTELSSDELKEVADRISKLLIADLDHVHDMASFDKERDQQQNVRSTRLVFLIRALGRTELSSVSDTLLKVVERGQEPYTSVAIQEIANLHDVVPMPQAIPLIAKVAQTSDQATTLLTACPALSVIAPHQDPTAIKALKRVYTMHGGEVSWSAALALARLGSDAAKPTMLDLLDRKFWESGERYQKLDAQGQTHRYAMPKAMVDQWLLAAIDVVPELNDPDLWEMVDRLKSDPSLAVRAKAEAVLSART